MSTFLDNAKNLFTEVPDLFPSSGSQRYDIATSIDESLWNQFFPYELAVLKASTSTNLSGSDERPGVRYDIYEGLKFTLPISPEQLVISTPFAINVSATLGGVVEQHGGAPFRQISFSGTFGVVSDRPTATQLQNERLEIAGTGIFAGTLSAAASVATQATSLGSGQRYTANLSSADTTNSDIQQGSTGYYHFRALQRFLETYADAKKQSGGADLRLAIFIWKEDVAYLVTPLAFDVTKTAATPFEYHYSLRFQAWRRVSIGQIGVSASGVSAPSARASTSYSLVKAYRDISNAIRLANSVTNTLHAVRKDIANVFNVLRQVAHFCSATAGISRTFLSLPKEIRKVAESAVRESWNEIAASFDGLSPSVGGVVQSISSEVAALNSGTATSTPTLTTALSDDSQADLHDLIHPDSLNLSPAQRQATGDYLDQTLSLTSTDFRAAAENLFSVITDFADVVGLNNATYDKVTGRVPKVKVRDATLDDFRAMQALSTAATAIQALVVNAPSRIPITTIEYVAGLANANGIAMRVPKSKFAVPFPYGSSLERLSQQYLGDATRWMEIAELNELRAPYVDETGITQLIASNGSGNLLNMTDVSTLVLGQYISVWSNTFLSERRRVLALKQLSATQWQVTVDGEANLNLLKTVDVASIQWFLVGTVNSQRVIYIPSDSPSNPDILKYVPNESDFNRILTIGEVDGMLSNTGDLVITPDGDWPVVFGMSCLIQWARTALNTRVGTLPLHPTFGIDVGVGDSLADSTAADILKSVKKVFQFNSNFTGVSSALVTRNGPTTQISLELGIAGVDSMLPLTFNVKG